jgi:hypothetical protein
VLFRSRGADAGDSRPDIFQLHVDRASRTAVTYHAPEV